MKEIETTWKDIGRALLIDAGCFAPFAGNALRVIIADEIGVDYFDPKNTNDQLWILGTFASFIPVATIITIKEKVKGK